MKAVVFSTFRQVRDFVAEEQNALLPKLYTMEEFLSRLVVVPGRIFVDAPSRVLYLYRAIESMDISALGFEKSFLGFVENADFFFRFFEELTAERVEIGALRGADMYAEYEEHLDLLQRVWERYREVLEAEGLVDRVTMPGYRLNEGFLRQLDAIEIHVDGYLSRFELELLQKVADTGVPLSLHFETTPYNARLKTRLELPDLPVHRRVVYDFGRKTVPKVEAVAPLAREKVTVAAFEDRMNQVAFVLERVAAFVEDGADPAKIAVVLPDEGFAEYLRLFDEHRNFNYAMGLPFSQSRYFRRLADLYDALSGRSESARLKMRGDPIVEAFEKVGDFAGFTAFLEGLEITPRELRVIDEVKYGFARYAPLLAHADRMQLLHTWLRQLENLSMDDTEGGKVTVMGVLESRGQRFDGVVLVDFNEEIVPSVGEKDLFLNTALRERAGMPTRRDKENLQKHYYYRLLRDAERAAVAYVKNEQTQPSRFLMQLGLAPSHETKDDLYRPILLPQTPVPNPFDKAIEGPNPLAKEPKLTPTKLKDLLLCPRRFHYRYILKIRPEEEEREKVLGSMIHEALEEAAREKHRFDDAESYFAFVMDRLYRQASGPLQRFEIALTWEERLRSFCERDHPRLMHSTQAALEAWCDTRYRGFELSSRVDRVDVTADTVRMIDYKTTKKMKDLLKDENDFQLCFYRVWAQRKWPKRRIVTVYEDIYGGETVVVDSGERMEAFDGVLDRLVAPATMRYDKTGDEKACRYCDYALACNR